MIHYVVSASTDTGLRFVTVSKAIPNAVTLGQCLNRHYV